MGGELMERQEKEICAFYVVGSIIGAILILLVACVAHAETFDAEAIADAIYKVEGGAKAKKPYGILSVKCSSEAECRQICINTVQNNFTRWQVAGAKGDYLEFLANRYAPPSAHPLNKNWLPNLRRVLK